MQLVSNWDFLTLNIIGQQILNKDSEDSNSWPTTTRVYAQLIAIQGCNNTQLNNSRSPGVSFRFETKPEIQKGKCSLPPGIHNFILS